MFDKLKKAFSRAAKGISQKELTEKVLDDVLLDLQIALLESDVAQEVVDDLSVELKKELLGLKLEREQEANQIVQSKLRAAVAHIFARTNRFDLIEKINAKKEAKAGPFVIVFLGINGTGKTTTVAKIANLLRKAGFSVVVAAGDTHRAGAIEQLEQHTNRLSLKIVKQRYGADPSSVGRDAYDHAKKNHIDIVLMDTAGRMQTSKNLMDEMGKIVRVVKPDVKLFIGDALAGNDTINQAREFFDYTNFDGAILTKVDADAKGGSAISIAHITSRPIIYIGVGQGYDDIIPFDSNKFIESLFESAGQVGIAVEDITPMQEISELAVEKVKSAEAQTVKEEEKDILLLSKPAVNPLSSMDSFSRPEEQKVETIDPKPVAQQPEPYKVKEQQPKEKKSRFGFFGKKRASEGRTKEEEEKVDNKENNKPQEERTEEKGAEEEAQTRNKDRNLEEDKDTREQEDEKDKIVYLTDEDIEDLLK
ncbi:MAG TPA: signal recognition particle-docking protein FtsY [Nitrososphaera sp.]|jgi:fused signal recognition particle receptor|nr:signal recognition particle-docking protein FtsY [Nitrososphaera sp.]